MADLSKASSEREIKCSPHKFYEHVKYSLHHLHTIFPEGYTDGRILEGDGESVGSLRQWKYILPANEEHTVKARTTKQDDENMVIALFAEDGDVHNHYQHFTAVVQVFPKDEGSMVKWTVEFEKHHDEIPDPHLFLELFDKITEKVDAHVHKPE
ncbi:hypothetical protein ACHQM5_009325 [Ranunculus cassubicifolius]